MIEEINIRQIFSGFVHFNKRNRKLILISIMIGVVSVILFQNLKPAYYNTKAICMSGISEYERLDQMEELSQRTPVDLINYLQINVKNKDYDQLSELLGISEEMTLEIRNIQAEQLYQQDMNERYYALNKFEISLSVFDNKIIDDVQKGLINYFNTNNFIKQYHKMYIDANNRLINEIDKEINQLSEMRIIGTKHGLDLSSVNVFSKNDKTISNQIISLIQLKEDINTNMSLLKPLFFVQDFTKTNKTERDILLWSILIGFICYLFSLIISFVRELS